ncbi:MAG TPA: ATP-binding protein [Zoogloea sp.]|nr:ATP-binding protein [Zoogloea sp.]
MVGLLEACRAGTATEADFVAADFDYLKADSVDLKDFSRLDSGKGMRPEVLARIFDPFYTTKPVGKGTRLGLSISYDIVIKHRGRIDVRSEPGCGSTFRVSLPRVAPA